jgi:membrane protein YdbS with pleckstrin-like domain
MSAAFELPEPPAPSATEPSEPGAHGASAPAVAGPVDLRLAPRFVAVHQLLAQLPVHLFLAAWGGCLFGGLVHVVLGLGGRVVPGWVPFVAAGGALAVALPWLSLSIGRRAYRDTAYVVRGGRLEYDEGFVALERRSLALSDVTRLVLRQGWLQRRHGLGTLIVSVAARSGTATPIPVRLSDVPEPERACARLRELLSRDGAGRRSRHAA